VHVEPETGADPHQERSRPARGLIQILEHLRFATVLVGVPRDDPIGFVQRLGDEVAPALRAHFS
jgi:hypothetical protein